MDCFDHGEDVPVRVRTGGSLQCRYCYNEYMKVYVTARYHRRRAEWIEKLGGKCVDCGTIEELEFDHDDPTTKSFEIADALSGWSKARLEAEMMKCVLRCAEHHRAKSAREQSVEHGQGLTGKRLCRCYLCAPLKDAYSRKYKHR